MDCFEQLKARLSSLEPAAYYRAFGYSSPAKLAKAIDKLQQHADLSSWLQSGFYDLHHTAKSFLLKGAEILNLPIAQCRSEIETAEQRLHQLAQAGQPVLTVQLNEAGNQRLSTLGFMGRMGASRWLTHAINKRAVIDLDQAALRAFMGELIQAHQQKRIPDSMADQVAGYLYKHTDGATLHFDKEGHPID